MRLLQIPCFVASVLLAGCQSDGLARRDSLGFGAGDAVAANMATHVIDPWPSASRQLYVATDGERAARAVERYRTGAQVGSGSQPGSLAASVSNGSSSTGQSGSGSALR